VTEFHWATPVAGQCNNTPALVLLHFGVRAYLMVACDTSLTLYPKAWSFD